MDTPNLVSNYLNAGTISEDNIKQFHNNNELRVNLCQYFFKIKNRPFALHLLNKLIKLRIDPIASISMEDLMLGCYILGLHQKIEDCLVIWKAKNVDFDSYCGVDIQLLAFSGVVPTINYLQAINTAEAKELLERIKDCYKSGDFDNLEYYFSPDNLPWWV